ncbi:MAG: endoribonuclease MazF [Terriglobia bacterium]
MQRGVVKREWTPDVGDIVWLTFDPQAGREQAGRRPAMILSPSLYNRKSGLALACPITSHIKGYPFEVELPAGLVVSGAVLADHLRSVDWRIRKAQPAGRLPAHVLQAVLDRRAPLMGF